MQLENYAPHSCEYLFLSRQEHATHPAHTLTARDKREIQNRLLIDPYMSKGKYADECFVMDWARALPYAATLGYVPCWTAYARHVRAHTNIDPLAQRAATRAYLLTLADEDPESGFASFVRKSFFAYLHVCDR